MTTELKKEGDAGDLVPARCPKCGGDVVAGERGERVCQYCGTTFSRADAPAAAADLRGLYGAGFSALATLDYERAYGYFSRIVEINPREYDAWVNKGVAGVYAHLNSEELVQIGELFSCMDAALAHYDAPDRAAFERGLADKVGALAKDAFLIVLAKRLNEEKNLRACVEMLQYWEKGGSDEEGCWRAIVAVAEQPAIPPKASRKPNTIYVTTKYPLQTLAVSYGQKIRAKYDAAFATVYERGAAEQRKINKEFARLGKAALTIAAVVIMFVLVVAVVVIAAAAAFVGGFIR